MSRTLSQYTAALAIRSRAVTTIAVTGLTLFASSLSAQAALGTPFIGSNNLSFRASELTRSGAAETTTLFGFVYGHRFGAADAPTRVTMVLRGGARPFDDSNAGVLDAGASVGVSREVAALPGLSVAVSTGVGTMAWSDDVAKTARLHATIATNAGASYDLHVRRATLSPFVMGSVARYDIRTALNDVRQSTNTGWDASYTTGVSLRLTEVVLTASQIIGEYGMPNHSRWAFAAGVSF